MPRKSRGYGGPRRKVSIIRYRLFRTASSAAEVDLDLYEADEDITLVRTIIDLKPVALLQSEDCNYDLCIHRQPRGTKVVANTSIVDGNPSGANTFAPTEEIWRSAGSCKQFGASIEAAATRVEKHDIKGMRKLGEKDTITFSYIADQVNAVALKGYIVLVLKHS